MTDLSLYSTIIKKKNSESFCSNCGNHGHIYKACPDPIISIGIICVNIKNQHSIPFELLNDAYTSIINDTGKIKSNGIRYKDRIDATIYNAFKDSISFTLIRRKYTLGYIEFIRGRYKINNIDGLIYLFEQMTRDEINMIREAKGFDVLWNDLWVEKDVSTAFINEYKMSKEKFNKLKNIKSGAEYFNLEFYLDNVIPAYDLPEWGFPKGRRSGNETDIECAIREFIEETGMKRDDFIVAESLTPIEEEFIGTNGVKYKHIYYIAVDKKSAPLSINKKNKHQISEIGDIGSFDYNTASGLIRPYHTTRKIVLSNCYMYVINKLIEAINNPEKIKFE